MTISSQKIKIYFDQIKQEINRAYALATEARKKGYDPEEVVEINLAENMAERVVGLLSTLAPQIVNSGIVERIIELEKQYEILDWRVAFKMAEEVAQEKFCKFKDKKEAIEMGIRVGFAYLTLGTVSSPIDGLLGIDIKKRMDGTGEYFCLNFAGPIRNAGGTAAAVCVLIGDHVRKKAGYLSYDATEEEIKRANIELRDYHERVTNLQYFPSEEEIIFLMKNLPVEINGDPSEKIEVSNYKDLPRIPTNYVRSGFCLILSSCIPLKAPKLWKQLSKWGREFDMSQWDFIHPFLDIQKKSKAKGGTEKKEPTSKISPDYTYIADLVAGRPVLGYPLRSGGFRLRYGRNRISGYSAQSIHPATMYVLNNYIATGTQLKVERPGKATSLTSCSLIDGPIVKLTNQSVMKLDSIADAKQYADQIEEIIYLGDVLICYGDFFNRAHPLVPAGYCPEWWAQEIKKEAEKRGLTDFALLNKHLDLSSDSLQKIIQNPLEFKLSYSDAKIISQKLAVPVHPDYTFFWNSISVEQFIKLIFWFNKMKKHESLSDQNENKIVLYYKKEEKRALELLGVPHTAVSTEYVIIEQPYAQILTDILSNIPEENLLSLDKEKDVLSVINLFSPYLVKDKAGTFIGARMGRPEKAKMRKMTGNPHTLFPVGKEGGKHRSVQNCLSIGKVTAELPLQFCQVCKKKSILFVCETCGMKTKNLFFCPICKEVENCPHNPVQRYLLQTIDIKKFFFSALKLMRMDSYPALIKGVRGTNNKDHLPEHLAKGILRSKHDVYINKDGTIRYDITQLPITHFKPKETGTSLQKLRLMGYEKDIHGKDLESEDQIVEIFPQDVILPACNQSFEEGSDKIFFRATKFIDDLLNNFYKLRSYYTLQKEEDLIGQLVICLAPHTSAGIAGRIIGFTKTQGFFAHPMLHAATRRDADGDEIGLMLLMDGFLNFSKNFLPNSRGATMDAPLVLTSVLDPTGIDDMVFDVDIAWQYPLEFYEAALQYKLPWEVKIKQIKETLNTESQYEGMGFTHDTDHINNTVLCSAYKSIPSMEDKLKGQMVLAEKIRAVDASEVAKLVIEKHFLKDAKGNLRKFSTQEFRCVECNEKYRRVPLIGKCRECGGKLIFTVSEGNVIKYLQPMMSLARKYQVGDYLIQSLELLERRIEGVFGKEKEKQAGLGAWFG